ncbi:MAG: hypothetical protein K2O31_04710 [Clostridia bacterium]|nr:hypothetical protein [Clostridia bacterium]MDE7209164.1 hypothetical protein [Clostridia bacterium]
MFAFVPIAFVAFGIIAVIISVAKQNAENKKKAEAEKAMKLLDDKEEFKKFLEYDSSESRSRPQQRPQQSEMAQRPAQPQPTQYRSPQPARQQMTAELQQRLAELKRRQAEREVVGSKNIVTTSHHDSHCDVSHKDNRDRYRVEYVPTMNSIGGKSTEGCQDHYNVRYVKLDGEDDNELELTPLQKAIVYGEVINQPAFKRQYGSRRLR